MRETVVLLTYYQDEKRRPGVSYFRFQMPRHAVAIAPGGVTWAGAFLAAVLACACAQVDRSDSLPGDPELRELALLLRTGAGGETVDPSAAEVGRRFLEVLSPVEEGLPGYVLDLESVRFGGVSAFELTLRNPDTDPVLGLHFFYRPGLPEALRETYGDHQLAGFPAMATPGEQVFVLAGNVEARVFQRAAEFRSDERLLEVVSLLPLDALAEL